MFSFSKLRAVGLILMSTALALSAACGSSSGDRIVFVSEIDGDAEIYLLNPATGEATPLTDNQNRDFNPRISPDGKSIAYLSDESGGIEINLVDAEGESIVRLTHNVGDDQYPQWSPNGKRLAFISHQDTGPEVYTMARDGSQQTRITTHAGVDIIGDWSPDGEWLVFNGRTDGPERGLWLRNPAGVNLVRLTTEPDTRPVWSPNGTHIAFVRTDGENSDIYMLGKLKNGTWQDDTELTPLTQHQAADISPEWSPDGTAIVFVSWRNGNAEIYTMRDDGSRQRRLTNNEADDITPVWSPDGSQISFVSYLYGPGEIFVMDADGSKQRRLTNNQTEDHSPDW